jgi:tRNA modification GTPase
MERLDELRERILSLLVSGGIPSRNTVLLIDTWERNLLRRMADALERAITAFESGATPDIAAEELRSALRAAGELQGIDVSESILAQIFSRFCVGK